MIINDSINKRFYRYDDHLYNPGDLMDIIDTRIRNINTLVLDKYSSKLKYDFSNGYIYMMDHYGDETFGHSMYLYEVEPIGPLMVGSDNYSIDKCNDYIKSMYKSSTPSESSILSIVDKYVNLYQNDKSGLQSYIAPQCMVLRRINL